jgi:hypothetical protein
MDLVSHTSIFIYRVFHRDTNARATLYHLSYLFFTLASSQEHMSQTLCIRSLRMQQPRERSCTGYFVLISINGVIANN